jgi:hypothetical protein
LLTLNGAGLDRAGQHNCKRQSALRIVHLLMSDPALSSDRLLHSDKEFLLVQ